MICPVMSSPVYSKFHDHATVLVDCKGVACRWWSNENCIVFDIAGGLKGLSDTILEASRMLRPPIDQQIKEVPDDVSHSKFTVPTG